MEMSPTIFREKIIHREIEFFTSSRFGAPGMTYRVFGSSTKRNELIFCVDSTYFQIIPSPETGIYVSGTFHISTVLSHRLYSILLIIYIFFVSDIRCQLNKPVAISQHFSVTFHNHSYRNWINFRLATIANSCVCFFV